MTWQDWVFTGGFFVLTLSLWPMLKNRTIVPLSTAVVTATCMTAFVICFTTLNLPLSATMESLGAISWWILVYYSWQNGPID